VKETILGKPKSSCPLEKKEDITYVLPKKELGKRKGKVLFLGVLAYEKDHVEKVDGFLKMCLEKLGS
jgi:hypothetical protein